MRHFWLLTLAASFGSLPVRGAEAPSHPLKIAVIDMKGVFERYHRTKEAEKRINERRNQSKNDPPEAGRSTAYHKAVDQVRRLQDELARPELPAEVRQLKSAERDELLIRLETLKREIDEVQSNREKELQKEMIELRASIVTDIMNAVEDRARAGDYDFVLDQSGPGSLGTPFVFCRRDFPSLTEEVVKILNQKVATPSVKAKER